jgi:hypothetical protein
MSIAHYAAVKSRLEEIDLLEIADTVRVDNENNIVRENYAVLNGGNADELDDERLSKEPDPNSDAVYVYRVASVAVTADGARRIAERTSNALVGFKPQIPGRNCRAIRRTLSDPVIPDYNVRPPMFYAVDEYTLTSLRGTPPDEQMFQTLRAAGGFSIS